MDGNVNEWAPSAKAQSAESQRGLKRALIHRDDKGQRAKRRIGCGTEPYGRELGRQDVEDGLGGRG